MLQDCQDVADIFLSAWQHKVSNTVEQLFIQFSTLTQATLCQNYYCQAHGTEQSKQGPTDQRTVSIPELFKYSLLRTNAKYWQSHICAILLSLLQSFWEQCNQYPEGILVATLTSFFHFSLYVLTIFIIPLLLLAFLSLFLHSILLDVLNKDILIVILILLHMI